MGCHGPFWLIVLESHQVTPVLHNEATVWTRDCYVTPPPPSLQVTSCQCLNQSFFALQSYVLIRRFIMSPNSCRDLKTSTMEYFIFSGWFWTQTSAPLSPNPVFFHKTGMRSSPCLGLEFFTLTLIILVSNIVIYIYKILIVIIICFLFKFCLKIIYLKLALL